MIIARLRLSTTLLFCWAITWMLAGSTVAQTPATGTEHPVKYDSGTISGLNARNIGSATMSGRVAAVDAVDENGKITLFVGSASGGVWKSINGATTFKPVFDKEKVQSIIVIPLHTQKTRTHRHSEYVKQT